MVPDDFEYDVALSFAGEDRPYVKQVADSLTYRNVRVFYDEMQKAKLWGEDLYEALDAVYRGKSRFVLMFVSADYASKAWPNHERRSAQAHDLASDGPYILPVRLDDTEVPGLRPTVGHVDSRTTSVYELVDLVIEKLGAMSEQLDEGSGWEFLLFLEELENGLSANAEAKRDFDMGIAGPSDEFVSEETAPQDLLRRMQQSLTLVNNMEKILQPDVLEGAFGAPGEPGDRVRIRHVVARLTDVYTGMMTWAAALRGMSAPEDVRPLYLALAKYVAGPIRQYNEWVEEMGAAIRPAVESLRDDSAPPQPIALTFTLKFDIDQSAMDEFEEAKDRYPIW